MKRKPSGGGYQNGRGEEAIETNGGEDKGKLTREFELEGLDVQEIAGTHHGIDGSIDALGFVNRRKRERDTHTETHREESPNPLLGTGGGNCIRKSNFIRMLG